jgi:DNA-binding PadR family transcriptional regulator
MDININLHADLIEGFEKELRRGSLVLVVLSLLQKPTHGYDLLSQIEASNINMDTDTLYPLLRRLESKALLESQWETSSSRPRKIYKLTELGVDHLKKMKTIWEQYGKNIERVIDHDKE